jgi:hypothetical protein
LAKGEPVEWRGYSGFCRKIERQIMPKIIEAEGKKMLYVHTDDNGTIRFKPVPNLHPEEYPYLSWRWKVSNILPNSRERETWYSDIVLSRH